MGLLLSFEQFHTYVDCSERISMKASELLIYIRDKVNLSGMKTLQARLKKLKDSIKAAFNSAPVRAFQGAVMAAGTAVAGAVIEGSRFNIQMSRVWTMAGGGIKNFRELRKEARGLAADFGKSRSEIAEGMYNALSAGVDQADLESFMSTAAKVAVADGSEISVAVDGITGILNAFGIEASKSEEITDQLFQTVKMGKATFGELAGSLSNTATTAAAAGVPFEQILAHIATLTSMNTPAAQATTQIRQSIIGLNKALGDGWAETMSYQEALKQVWEQSGQSQTELLKLVGSTEAMMAVLGGVGDNAATAQEKLNGMRESAGAASEAFNKVNQFRHWPTFLETARATLSKFGEEVDQRIRPFVMAVTAQLRSWMDNKGLWVTIGSVLDVAADRLNAAWQATTKIIGEINSLSDLGVVAEVVGDWLKEKLILGMKKAASYLLAKAPAVGHAIGKAVKESVLKIGQDKPDFARRKELQKQATKDVGGWNVVKNQRRYKELVQEETTKNREARFAEEGKKLSSTVTIEEASQQSLADRIQQALSDKESQELIDKLAVPYDEFAAATEQVKTVHEEMRNEWASLGESAAGATETAATAAEAAEESAKAAQEMHTASTSQLESTTSSHKDLRVTLQQSSDQSLQTLSEATETAEATANATQESAAATNEMQTATASNLDIVSKSHIELRNTLKLSVEQSKQTLIAAQQSAQALTQIQAQQEQIQTLLAQVSGKSATLQAELNSIKFQLQNLKV
jgi:TP901 family phage tail tape measure protein